MRAYALFLTALLAPVLAQDSSVAPRVGVSLAERKLTVEETLQLALRHNLEIEVERTAIASAGEALKGARGAFDPLFQFNQMYDRRGNPVANVLMAPDGKLVESLLAPNFYVRQRLPWSGVTFRFDFENGYNTTSNPFQSLTPWYTSRMGASASLPLWRGREIDPVRAEILVRSKNASLAETDLQLKVIDVVTRAQTAYWDLVAARQDVSVKEDGVKLAREQLGRSQRMIASGTLAPVELAAAEAEFQRRQDDYLASLATLTAAENNLKLLIAPNRSDAIWGDRLAPTERRQIEPPQDALSGLTAAALKRRPELRSLDLRKETNDVLKELAADQTRPQVNLVGGYFNTGLAGSLSTTGNPFSSSLGPQIARLNQLSAMAGLPPLPTSSFSGGAPAAFVGGYGSTLSNLFTGSYQSVQAGVQFELNPRNRAAQAQVSQAVLAEKRLALQRAQLEQAIEAQVRNALQALESARQRIAAAAAGERAAQEKLDSETRLFQTGESTNFLVLTRQNELLNSRLRHVAATLELNKAVARLEQAIGSTLASHNIRLAGGK
jgi:HAE1 family hydrophobic/amphiphilic exporter-1